MDRVQILVTTPAALPPEQIADLRTHGVFVVETPRPESIRLLRPWSEIEGGDLLRCALKALTSEIGSASAQREAFTRLVAELVGSTAGSAPRSPEASP